MRVCSFVRSLYVCMLFVLRPPSRDVLPVTTPTPTDITNHISIPYILACGRRLLAPFLSCSPPTALHCTPTLICSIHFFSAPSRYGDTCLVSNSISTRMRDCRKLRDAPLITCAYRFYFFLFFFCCAAHLFPSSEKFNVTSILFRPHSFSCRSSFNVGMYRICFFQFHVDLAVRVAEVFLLLYAHA